MDAKINEACGKLITALEKMTENAETLGQVGPSLARPFLISAKNEVEKLREDTINQIVAASEGKEEITALQDQIQKLQEEMMALKQEHEAKIIDATAKHQVLEAENTALRRETLRTQVTESAKVGDKRFRPVAVESDETEMIESPPRRRQFTLMSTIEQPQDYESVLGAALTFRGSAARTADLAELGAPVNRSVLWDEGDNLDGDSRMAWMSAHSTFEGSWSANDRSDWRKQMAGFVDKKELNVIINLTDDIAFGRRECWPPNPRPCFFGRIKRSKCSPGGEQTAKKDCEFCRETVVKGTDKNAGKCHCTVLLADDVADPYPARREAKGDVPFSSRYEPVIPFFNADGIRYVWTIHA